MPKAAVEVGVIILAFGDPVATIIGKKFGKRKLYGNKTIMGSLAFFSVALMAGSIVFAIAGPSLPTWKAAAMLVTVALAGTLTELACQRLDDNFAIPTITAGVATLWIAWPL
jgi:phytol kinase